MKVGIVIITYNNEGHVQDAINSVINQLYQNWICVMVDNGSTDRTFSIMEEHCKNDSRFTAFKKLNEGPAAGRNYGFSELPDDIVYVHFLDGDDYIKPEYISTMVDYLNNHPKVGLVACQFDKINNEGVFLNQGHRSRFAPSRFGLPHDLPLQVVETPFVSFFSSTGVGPFGVYRKSVFEQTDGYELESQEDTDMFCKMSLLAEVHYLPKYLYVKRITSNNLAFQESYQATHMKFRDKWDFYIGENQKENRIIENSIRYYYLKHVPLRDFKFAIKTFKEFLDIFNMNTLKQSMDYFKNGIMEVLIRKSYRDIMRKRKSSLGSIPDSLNP